MFLHFDDDDEYSSYKVNSSSFFIYNVQSRLHYIRDVLILLYVYKYCFSHNANTFNILKHLLKIMKTVTSIVKFYIPCLFYDDCSKYTFLSTWRNYK